MRIRNSSSTIRITGRSVREVAIARGKRKIGRIVAPGPYESLSQSREPCRRGGGLVYCYLSARYGIGRLATERAARRCFRSKRVERVRCYPDNLFLNVLFVPNAKHR